MTFLDRASCPAGVRRLCSHLPRLFLRHGLEPTLPPIWPPLRPMTPRMRKDL